MSLSEELLRGICQPTPFLNTRFPFPVTQSFFGRDFHWDVLEDQVEEIDEANVVNHLPLVLALAEGVEASQPDREEHFVSDKELKRRLAQLSQGGGWALVWGDGGKKTAQLLDLLHERRFQSYVVAPEPSPQRAGLTYLGDRPTSVIYYLQCLVRYAHIYGRIPLERTDEVTRFLEEHGPGVVFWLKEDPTSLERALLLGLMFLGTPAVVPSSYPLPLGNARRAEAPADMVEAALAIRKLEQTVIAE
ncbi:MAG: hypothetical protein HY671_05245 [Chloroflexi bacterium]|nr:hypothetical protein [Chloroflexota bacterium]